MESNIKILLTMFHWSGHLSLPNYFKNPLHNKLHQMFTLSSTISFLLYFTLQTFTLYNYCKIGFNCIRFLVDYQGLLCMQLSIFVNYVLYTRDLPNLLEEIRSFPIQDRVVHRTQVRKQNLIFYGVGGSFIICVFCQFGESFMPYTESQVQVMKCKLGVAFPDNRLPLPLAPQFLDVSEAPLYYFMYVWCVWYVAYAALLPVFHLNMSPQILVYMEGQFQIVSNYAHRIGSTGVIQEIMTRNLANLKGNYKEDEAEHRVSKKLKSSNKKNTKNDSSQIWRHDARVDTADTYKLSFIQTQDYDSGLRKFQRSRKNKVIPLHLSLVSPRQIKLSQDQDATRFDMQKYRHHHGTYLREVVYLHQKIMLLREQFDRINSADLNIRLSCCFLTLLLVTYQLAFDLSSSSESRGYVAFILIMVLLAYFLFVWTSEMIAEANSGFYRSLTDSLWYTLNPRDARRFLMILRRAQAQAALTCFHRTLHVTNKHFLDVLKIQYQMVNVLHHMNTD